MGIGVQDHLAHGGVVCAGVCSDYHDVNGSGKEEDY